AQTQSEPLENDTLLPNAIQAERATSSLPATKPRRLPLAIAIIIILVIIGLAVLLTTPRRDPEAAIRLNGAGLMALQQLNYNSAIENFLAATRADPSRADSYFNLGVAYEERGDTATNDTAAAIAAYRAALERDSQLLLARYRLAEMLLDQKANDEA